MQVASHKSRHIAVDGGVKRTYNWIFMSDLCVQNSPFSCAIQIHVGLYKK